MLFSEVATGHSFPAASAAIFLCHCPLVETKKKGSGDFLRRCVSRFLAVGWSGSWRIFHGEWPPDWLKGQFHRKTRKKHGKIDGTSMVFFADLLRKKPIHWGSWDSCEGNSCIYWTWIIDGLIMNIWWLMIVYSAFILSLFCVYSGLIEY